VVWLWVKGWLPSRDIDHHDGDRLNCAIGNLRPATKSQNAANRRPPKKASDLPTGCSYDARHQVWPVYVGFKGDRRFIGQFTSRDTAARSYVDAVSELHGEFAVTARPTAGARHESALHDRRRDHLCGRYRHL
jgi:hypothetical protein